MTGADITRLPATKLPGADTNSVKKSNETKFYDFGNIMMQKEQAAYRQLEVSDSKNSLKLVMQKKSAIQVNIKVDMKSESTNTKAQDTSNDVKPDAFKSDAKNDFANTKTDKNASESTQISKTVTTENTEIEEQVEVIVNEIKEILKEDLGISDDVIENIMTMLQMGYQNLFEQDNLMQFVGALNGDSNPASLLLVDGLKEVMNDLNALKETVDLSVFDFEATVSGEVYVDTDSNANVDVNDFSDVLNQTIENTVETKPEQVADEEPVVVVNDLRTSPKESNQTTIVEDAKAESVTGVENPLLSEDASKSSDSKNEFNGNKNNLFNKQTNVAPKEAPNTNTNVQTTFTVNAEATHIEITNASYQTTRVDVPSMIDKLVQTARVTLTDTSHTMEMILNPEELGKIFMSVTEKDGTIKARILAENETVKTALETQLVLLQDKFKANGMKIDSVEVSVGTHEFKEGQEESQALDMGMNNENNHSSSKEEESSQANLHRIDLNNLDGLQGLMSEEEKLTAQIMKDQGNTVSYQV